MSLVTYFKATLPCSRCGTMGITWIQSPLGDAGATYEVGDCPGDDIATVGRDDGLLLIREPEPHEPIDVLHSWTCQQCGLGNLAEVVLASGCVGSIEAVVLDPVTLARVHFMVSTLDDIVQRITGESIWTESGLRDDWLSRLRAALDVGKRW